MKIKEYCNNPLCSTNDILSEKFHSKTLIPVYYSTYYQQPKNKKKLPKLRSDKVAFYVCKECSMLSEFSKFPFREIIYYFKVNFIPFSYEERFGNLIKSREISFCLFCEQNFVETFEEKRIDAKTSERIPIKKPCIVKLFLKIPHKHIGYFCSSCKMCYLSTEFKEVNWDIAYKSQPVDVFSEVKLGKKALEKMGLSEKKKILTFDSIGSFSTSEGVRELLKKGYVTIPPLRVTKKQARKLIEKYGSPKQKKIFQLRDF